MILARFILKVVGFRILAALAVLFAVLQVLDLLDATTDVLDRGLGVSGVMRYAALRAPGLLIQAMPIAVLAGSLLAFNQLGRESAIIAMRASGISTFRLIGLSLPAALRSPAFYQMTLHRAWSTPFASLVMLLLAIPVVLVSYRGAQAPVVLALCLGAGLLFLVVDGLMAAVGESGVLPVLLAAWGGPIVFAAAAMMVLLREEGA